MEGLSRLDTAAGYSPVVTKLFIFVLNQEQCARPFDNRINGQAHDLVIWHDRSKALSVIGLWSARPFLADMVFPN